MEDYCRLFMNKDFEKRLNDNYNELKDTTIIKDIEALQERYPEPASLCLEGTTVPLIKCITKVACHFIPENGEGPPAYNVSDDFLAWVFDLGEIGIQKIRRGEYDAASYKCTPDNIKRMHAHILSHNSDIVREAAGRARNEEDRSYLFQVSYEKRCEAISIGREIAPQHTAYCMGINGNIAHAIADIEGNEEIKVKWLERAHNDYSECIQNSALFDRKHKAYVLSFRAEIARLLADYNRGQQRKAWLEDARGCYEEEVKLSGEFSERHLGHTLSHWHALDTIMVEEEEEESKKIELLRQAHQHGEEAVRMCRKYDKRHAAITAANVGRSDERLLELTGEEEYRESALRNYATFRNYFEENSELPLRGVFRAVCIRIKEIERKRDDETGYIREKREKKPKGKSRKRDYDRLDFE